MKKIKIDQGLLNQLTRFKNRMLLCDDGSIFALDSFDTEEVEETIGTFKKEKIKSIYLTKYNLAAVNTKEEYLGLLEGDLAAGMAHPLALLGARERFMKMLKNLKIMGFDIVEIPKKVPEKIEQTEK